MDDSSFQVFFCGIHIVKYHIRHCYYTFCSSVFGLDVYQAVCTCTEQVSTSARLVFEETPRLKVLGEID